MSSSCHQRWRPIAAASLLTLGALATMACDEPSPTTPSGQAVAVITVSGETFRVRLTTAEQIAAAQAARDGAAASIPIGRIVAGSDVNIGWSWHLVDVAFAEATIELCDGRPSMVEREGPTYANGWFCPWGARVVRVDQR